jgi:hypothetical protein
LRVEADYRYPNKEGGKEQKNPQVKDFLLLVRGEKKKGGLGIELQRLRSAFLQILRQERQNGTSCILLRVLGSRLR